MLLMEMMIRRVGSGGGRSERLRIYELGGVGLGRNGAEVGIRGLRGDVRTRIALLEVMLILALRMILALEVVLLLIVLLLLLLMLLLMLLLLLLLMLRRVGLRLERELLRIRVLLMRVMKGRSHVLARGARSWGRIAGAMGRKGSRRV